MNKNKNQTVKLTNKNKKKFIDAKPKNSIS